MNENDKIVEISNSGTNMPNGNTGNVNICAEIPTMPIDPQYAYAYIKFQNTVELCDADTALENGTVFPQLNMPYRGRNAR